MVKCFWELYRRYGDQGLLYLSKELENGINFHLTGGVQIFLGGVHWCATKELTEHCSSSTTVVGHDLVVSHIKL